MTNTMTWPQIEAAARRLHLAVEAEQCDPEAADQRIRLSVEAASAAAKPDPKPGDRVKEIGWAYPTSENAVLFGYGKTGCWTLSEGVWPEPLMPVAGSAGVSPLICLGERLEGVWSPRSMA